MNPYETIAETLKNKLTVELATHKNEETITALRDVIMYANWKAFNQKLADHIMEQEKTFV